MATRKQAGFSLIELIIATAISASLIVIAFMGQRGLRSQAQFDASVNKVVSSISDAHNQATAGVNTTTGSSVGTGVLNCSGGTGALQQYIFAGVAWSAVDAPSGATIQFDYYKASRVSSVSACAFMTKKLDLPSSIRVDAAPTPNQTRRILFVRDNFGGLRACWDASSSTAYALSSFSLGTCAAVSTNISIILTDADAHRSQIEIDSSGLAKRLN